MLKILLDQNIPPPIKTLLQRIRPEWEIHHASELGMAKDEDVTIFEWGRNHQAVIFTCDEDFSDARILAGEKHSGIVRFNVWPTTVEILTLAVTRLLHEIEEATMKTSVIIVDKTKIRVR